MLKKAELRLQQRDPEKLNLMNIIAHKDGIIGMLSEYFLFMRHSEVSLRPAEKNQFA